MRRSCRVVRVFTRDGVGGNHLGVIDDLSGLGDESMQEIAADLGFSETIFADWSDHQRPARVRIFTPAAELAFAGHPLVGAAWVRHHFVAAGPGELECGAGVVRYRVEGDSVWVEASVPVVVDDVLPDPGSVAALGFARPLRCWTVRLPIPYLLAEMAADADVASARPDPDLLADTQLYLFHRTPRYVHARFFAPSLGVVEDPATGSAAVALAHALSAAGEGQGDLVVRQGEEMGSPSSILLRWHPGVVEIGGAVADEGSRLVDR